MTELTGSLPEFKGFEPLREGIDLVLRGREPDASGEPTDNFVCVTVTLPPMNLGVLKSMESRFAEITNYDAQGLETVRDAVFRTLKRNYAGIPRWLIDETIDIGNIQETMQSLMDVSGLHRKEIEAAKKATAVIDSTGTTPTAT